MKTLAAIVTALTLLGISGAAFACDGMYQRTGDTAANERLIPPPNDKTS